MSTIFYLSTILCFPVIASHRLLPVAAKLPLLWAFLSTEMLYILHFFNFNSLVCMGAILLGVLEILQSLQKSLKHSNAKL